MKVIIAGGRDMNRTRELSYALAGAKADGIEVTMLICGMASGVDMMAWHWANTKGLPILEFPADWQGLGKKAGPVRNEEMAKHADALIAIWDGHSRGTAHMIRTANKLGLKVYIHRVTT